MNIFPPSVQLLQKSLDAASLKQRVISANIANVDTPFYKAKEVVFQSELKKALQNQSGLPSYQTHEKHIPFSTERHSVDVQPQVVSHPSTFFNHNQNNVDIDLQMAELAKNQLWYNSLVEMTTRKLSGISNVIKGGR